MWVEGGETLGRFEGLVAMQGQDEIASQGLGQDEGVKMRQRVQERCQTVCLSLMRASQMPKRRTPVIRLELLSDLTCEDMSIAKSTIARHNLRIRRTSKAIPLSMETIGRGIAPLWLCPGLLGHPSALLRQGCIHSDASPGCTEQHHQTKPLTQRLPRSKLQGCR